MQMRAKIFSVIVKICVYVFVCILPTQDRVYVNQHEPMNVYDLGLTLFRDEVLHHAGVRDRLKRDLLEVIACERRGEIRERLIITAELFVCVHVHV